MGGDDKSEHRRRRAPRVGSTGARFPRFNDDEDLAAPSSEPPAPPVLPPGDDADGDGAVGRTGARFNSRTRRDRRDAERAAAEDAAVPPQARPALGPFASAEPEPDDAPTIRIPRAYLNEADTRTRVRPYVRTRGRTRTRTDLAVETLVSIPSPRPSIENPEHAAIDGVCDEPRSVAEVAALLEIPLGVARVLIDDMAAAGLLTVHATATKGGAPPPDILRRVLDGLHRL